jgi:hypothetical protein
MWLVHKEYTPWFRSLVDTKLKTGNAIVLRNPDEIEGFIRDVAGETNLRPNNRMQPDAAKLRR